METPRPGNDAQSDAPAQRVRPETVLGLPRGASPALDRGYRGAQSAPGDVTGRVDRESRHTTYKNTR